MVALVSMWKVKGQITLAKNYTAAFLISNQSFKFSSLDPLSLSLSLTCYISKPRLHSSTYTLVTGSGNNSWREYNNQLAERFIAHLFGVACVTWINRLPTFECENFSFSTDEKYFLFFTSFFLTTKSWLILVVRRKKGEKSQLAWMMVH